MWYVVQTLKGKEEKVTAEIREYVLEDGEEAFIMGNERMFRIRGRWIIDRKNLFPGYLFVITEKPKEFDRRLRKKLRPLKLMEVDEVITPIYPEEEEFLKLLGGEEHIVRYSEGCRIGDKVVIESGALAGYKGEIRKLDRHNRQAVITVSFFGRETDVTLGLGIVKSVSSPMLNS